jgi:hypothetical protein
VTYDVVRFKCFVARFITNSSVSLRASLRDGPFNFKFSLSVVSRTSRRDDSFYFRFNRV